MEETTVETTQDKLDAFHEKCRKHFEQLAKWQDFWSQAIEAGIEVPYNAHDSVWNRYVNVAQHRKVEVEEGKTEYQLDTEATKKEFAKIVKWARKNGWTVKKNYTDDQFEIRVEGMDDPISFIEFYSTRQVVCKKVQVGTKHVEAHDEPVYEYQCDKVAFLSVEV